MSRVEKDVPTELKNALSRFDDLESRFLDIWLAITQADGGKFFPLDFFVQGAIKRSLSLIMGVRLMLENSNLVCARSLLRMQIDTAMRLYAAWLVPNPHDFAQEVISGKRIHKMKCRNGRLLTDKYLSDELSREHEWVRRVYESTSGYVHLSQSQSMLTVEDVHEEGTMSFVIAAHDKHMPVQSFIEVAECFVAASEIVMKYLEGWRFTKANPEVVAELKKKNDEK